MNARKTIAIAVILALAIGAYLFDQGRRERNEETRLQESRLVAAGSDSIVSLQLERRTSDEPIHLEKIDDRWRLTQPVADGADEQTVRDLLRQIDQARRQTPFVPRGGVAEYGLDEPTVTVRITTADGELPPLHIGDRTPDDTASYARFGDDREVFVVDRSLVRVLGSTVLQLRDKRLLPVDITEATSLTLATPTLDFRLQRVDGDWRLVAPIEEDADDLAISELLGLWNSAQTTNFIDEPEMTPGEMGLEIPFLRATIGLEGEDGEWREFAMLVGDVVTTGVPRIQRFATTVPDDRLFTITDELAQRLVPSLDQLRDKTLLTLAAEDVDRFQITVVRNVAQLERDDEGRWHLTDEPETALDQAFIDDKLSALVRLRATRFFDDRQIPDETTGMNDPNVIATLFDEDSGTSQTLMTGRRADDGDWVYARLITPERTMLVGVDWRRPGDFFELTRENMLDKQLLKFETSAVAEIAIRDGATSLTLKRRDSGSWEAIPAVDGEEPGEAFTVQPMTVDDLFFSLEGMQWRRKLNPQRPLDLRTIEQYHVTEPRRWIILRDAEGEQLALLGLASTSNEHAYVSTGREQYYAVDIFRIDPLDAALRTLMSQAGAALEPLPNVELETTPTPQVRFD